jgi:hypothetical protein
LEVSLVRSAHLVPQHVSPVVQGVPPHCAAPDEPPEDPLEALPELPCEVALLEPLPLEEPLPEVELPDELVLPSEVGWAQPTAEATANVRAAAKDLKRMGLSLYFGLRAETTSRAG